jgi:hypothetical protein
MGVMVPDEEVMIPWAKENGMDGSFSDICSNKVQYYEIYIHVYGVGMCFTSQSCMATFKLYW